ncbi:U4/U6 small nuclear ribonucleoprotein Prp3 [Phlebotomus argentipes]|uniref:U4/U6 small nuclear ribonucleoprotein Prp3 n=1 Tax=Phlebotomus argentipes TaxID=94469 RepID=UPI0028934413|nr:U4/U6 small nuclear ribonucleoprotein Prp3 [Phlebotomus argentipes]
MSYLSRKELSEVQPDLERVVTNVLGGTSSSVLQILQSSLHSGYDRRKTSEKLSSVLDGKSSGRLLEKVEHWLVEYQSAQKGRKRHHEEDVRERETKKGRMHGAEAANQGAAEEGKLTTDRIKQMMLNAQREIEERKKALKSDAEPKVTQTVLPTMGNTPEDIERARKIANLQAQIKAKLSGSLAKIITPVSERPKPLILDSEGRTVDKSGREVNIPTLAPTLKANIRAKKREVFNKAQLTDRQAEEGQETMFFDDRINLKAPLRNKRSLRFHEPGKFQQMAEKMRMKKQLEKLQNEISQIARRTGISSATKLALIAPKQDNYSDDVPQMEWWDSVILSDDLNTLKDGRISIRESAITNLIEHPTQIKPPSEPMKAVYMPVFLTKKERKKLRRQNRREAWKEEQEKIRLGLSAPPEPKLRISNLMRVLGTEAVQDPTKIESHVREQMAKRQKAHEEANAARKLTAEQKREKKIRKIKEDTSLGVHVSVYRVRDLHDNLSKKFKVETNAKQLHMTGVIVLFRDCCVVVIEGGPKQQKKFRRLMLSRIKWEEDNVKNADGNEVPNSCALVWEGTSQRRHFGEIKFKSFPMEKMAREFFQKYLVEQYWDLAYSGAVLEASEDT